MDTTRKITSEEAEQTGSALGLDWKIIDLRQFRRGMEVELEHGSRDADTDVTNDDLEMTGRIAWAHLKEIPDYYTRLARLETRANLYWASRRQEAAPPV